MEPQATSRYKNFLAENYLFIIFSLIAAAGTYPYGYKFARLYAERHEAQIILGLFFGVASAGCNAILGLYSLINTKMQDKKKIGWYVYLLSFLASIPVGFLCYYGYVDILPSVVNIIFSCIVSVVNIAISITAISDTLSSFKNMIMFVVSKEIIQVLKKNISYSLEIIVRCIGFIVGFLVSLVGYLAASSGLSNIGSLGKIMVFSHYPLSHILAAIAWIPTLALFGNSNQYLFGQYYGSLVDYRKLIRGINIFTVMIIVICAASGTAYAEMIHEFFDINKNIPAIFKAGSIQIFAHSYLEMIAIIASGSVNFLFLNRFISLRFK